MTKIQKLTTTAMQAATPAMRLEAFLLIDAAGLPGALALRERQARIRARLTVTPIMTAATYTPRYTAGQITGYTITGKPLAPAQDLRKLYGIHTRVSKVGGSEGWRSLVLSHGNVDRNRRRAFGSGDADLALSLAESYHSHVASLYTSKRAGIVYRHSPESVTDRDAYAKSYGHPATYMNAAVHVDYRGSDTFAMLHTVRGCTIEVPLARDVEYHHPCLLDGDLYCRIQHTAIATRYNADGESTGFAVRFLKPDATGYYWEHGYTIAECREEYAKKSRLHQDRQLVVQATQRQQRKARLVARLCGKLECTVADAKALGYCNPGIDAFRSRYSLGEVATVAQLRGTGSPQVLPVIKQAALRCVVTQKQESN